MQFAGFKMLGNIVKEQIELLLLLKFILVLIINDVDFLAQKLTVIEHSLSSAGFFRSGEFDLGTLSLSEMLQRLNGTVFLEFLV